MGAGSEESVRVGPEQQSSTSPASHSIPPAAAAAAATTDDREGATTLAEHTTNPTVVASDVALALPHEGISSRQEINVGSGLSQQLAAKAHEAAAGG